MAFLVWVSRVEPLVFFTDFSLGGGGGGGGGGRVMQLSSQLAIKSLIIGQTRKSS